jgi:replicative DNA helicase
MSFKLARVAKRGLTSGEPLPDAYATLKEQGIRLYRGGVVLVAGTPGSMKTMFILNLVDKMKIPTLYISNDSNEMTIVSRMLARRTKQDSRLMRDKALRDPDWAFRVLSDMDWVRWNFSPSPTLDEIEEEVMAFEELWGDLPHLVVVDILMKVDYVEDGGGTDESIVRYLDKLARETGACFVVACHTSENVEGNPCQPLRAVLNKISKIPIMVLTCAYKDGVFFLCPAKNRDGTADATGNRHVTFLIDPSIATLEELE